MLSCSKSPKSIWYQQYAIHHCTACDYPHCHIVFNRVDNDGKTISDKNDFLGNEKACKMLTEK